MVAKAANRQWRWPALGASVARAVAWRGPIWRETAYALRSAQLILTLLVVDQEEASGTAFIFLGPDGNNSLSYLLAQTLASVKIRNRWWPSSCDQQA